ncbi:tudor domain-containing protein 1 [Anopheles stephensi]|uniref:tudor domain-containing protein 1 n=1 Tax=Anopheles stephensi TaxID=30069 RepID=UPI001658C012|nr:tudor domain-containing protein 1 [Anopheles stephensi]
MAAYEQLWDVSYEYLEKHAVFVNAITNLMLEKARHLRHYIFGNGLDKRAVFQEDFKAAHDELQKMTKTLQTVVNDWKDLFADESASLCKPNATVPLQTAELHNDLTVEYIKPTLDYATNQNIKLVVTYIPPSSAEPGTFYAMDESRKNDFRDSLMPMQKAVKTLLNQTPSPGVMFLVYLDSLWHRVVCHASTDDKNALELYLLDLGETLPYEELLPKAILPAEFCKLPAFAIKCALAPNQPGSLPFKQYDTVDCKVVAVQNDLLVLQHEAGGQEAPQYAITRDTFTEAELEQLDDISSSTTNAMKAVLGYIPKDDEVLCKHYDPDTKGCFKGGSCRFRHAPKDPDGWTVEKDTVSVTIPAQMEIPLPNTYITLYPTCIVDVDLFYAHIAGDEENYRRYEQLMAEMNDPAVVANYKTLKLAPALGELVIAKYDDVWFRAVVCDVYDAKVSVFYVDYGNTATVGTNEVRRWEERFKYLPYQAVCCRIANIQRLKPCLLEGIQQLQEYILDQYIKTLIVDNKHPWEVIMYGPDGDDIGKRLVMSKMALPRKPAKFDDDSYIPG